MQRNHGIDDVQVTDQGESGHRRLPCRHHRFDVAPKRRRSGSAAAYLRILRHGHQENLRHRRRGNHYSSTSARGVWVLESRETHRFVKPGSRDRLESVATRIFIWPKGTQETYGRISDAGSTEWYVPDGQKPWKNRYNFYLQKDFTTGELDKISHPYMNDVPAVEFKSKQWLVGSRTWYTGLSWLGTVTLSSNKHVGRWRTYMKLTAQHTSGGAKRFTVIIDYYVEGSPTATRITQHVTLSPGETTTMTLSTPSGDWASIGGVTIRENAPPAPIPNPSNGGRSGNGDGPSLNINIPIGPIEIEIPITPNAQSTNQAQRPSGNGN